MAPQTRRQKPLQVPGPQMTPSALAPTPPPAPTVARPETNASASINTPTSPPTSTGAIDAYDKNPAALPNVSRACSGRDATATTTAADVTMNAHDPGRFREAYDKIRAARPLPGSPLKRAILETSRDCSPRSMRTIFSLIDSHLEAGSENENGSKDKPRHKGKRQIDWTQENRSRRQRLVDYLDSKWGHDAWVPPFKRDSGVLLTSDGLNQKDISYLATITELASADGIVLQSLFQPGGAVYQSTIRSSENPIWNFKSAKEALNLYKSGRIRRGTELTDREARAEQLVEPLQRALSEPISASERSEACAALTGDDGLSDQSNDLYFGGPLSDYPSPVEFGRRALSLNPDGENSILDPHLGEMSPESQNHPFGNEELAAASSHRGSFLFTRASKGKAVSASDEVTNCCSAHHPERTSSYDDHVSSELAEVIELDGEGGFVERDEAAEIVVEEDKDTHQMQGLQGSTASQENMNTGTVSSQAPAPVGRSTQQERQRTLELLSKPSAWLTDEAILVLQREILAGQDPDVLGLDPLHVNMDGPAPRPPSKLWTRKRPPDPTYLVFALHHRYPGHWTLAIVQVPLRLIQWYDPQPDEERTARTSSRLLALLKNSFPQAEDFVFSTMQGPTQPDHHSCGVYILTMLWHWAGTRAPVVNLEPPAARHQLRDLLLVRHDSKDSHSPNSLSNRPKHVSQLSASCPQQAPIESDSQPPAKRSKIYHELSDLTVRVRNNASKMEDLVKQQAETLSKAPATRYRDLEHVQRFLEYVKKEHEVKIDGLRDAQDKHQRAKDDLAKAQTQLRRLQKTDDQLTPGFQSFIRQHADFPHGQTAEHIDSRAFATYETTRATASAWLADREKYIKEDEAQVDECTARVADTMARLCKLRAEEDTLAGDLEELRVEEEWHQARRQAKDVTEKWHNLM